MTKISGFFLISQVFLILISHNYLISNNLYSSLINRFRNYVPSNSFQRRFVAFVNELVSCRRSPSPAPSISNQSIRTVDFAPSITTAVVQSEGGTSAPEVSLEEFLRNTLSSELGDLLIKSFISAAVYLGA